MQFLKDGVQTVDFLLHMHTEILYGECFVFQKKSNISSILGNPLATSLCAHTFHKTQG